MASNDERLTRLRKERIVIHTPENHFIHRAFLGGFFALMGHIAALQNLSRVDFNLLSKNFDYGGLIVVAGLFCIYLGMQVAVHCVIQIFNFQPALTLDEEGIELNSGYFYRCEIEWDGIADVAVKHHYVRGFLLPKRHNYIEITLHNPRALIEPLSFWKRAYLQFPIPRKDFPIVIYEDSTEANLNWLAKQIRKRLRPSPAA